MSDEPKLNDIEWDMKVSITRSYGVKIDQNSIYWYLNDAYHANHKFYILKFNNLP